MLNSKSFKSRNILALFITIFLTSFILINGLLFGGEEFVDNFVRKFLQGVVRISLSAVLLSWIASTTIYYLNKHDFDRSTLKRWFIEFAILTVFSIIIGYLEARFIISKRDFPENIPVNPQNVAIGINMVLGVIIFAIYEIWTGIEQNQNLQLTLAQAEKDKIVSQLSTLQQKLNPHFLFNSLNVLSELIYEDREKANEFINEFSNVYRYVLELNDEPFVTISKELEFLNSYLFLQKIRFGDSIIIDNKINDQVKQAFIPPLSFQLLIENAIKHNEVSKAKPLRISLTNKDGMLVVKNNLQARSDEQISSGVGHSNLISTYALLTGKQPKFFTLENEYVAMIPILKSIS